MTLRKQQLIALGARDANAARYLASLNQQLPLNDIDSPLRVAHFLSQVYHESSHLRVVQENLNYSSEGLRAVFGKYYKTDAAAHRQIDTGTADDFAAGDADCEVVDAQHGTGPNKCASSRSRSAMSNCVDVGKKNDDGDPLVAENRRQIQPMMVFAIIPVPRQNLKCLEGHDMRASGQWPG